MAGDGPERWGPGETLAADRAGIARRGIAIVHYMDHNRPGMATMAVVPSQRMTSAEKRALSQAGRSALGIASNRALMYPYSDWVEGVTSWKSCSRGRVDPA